MRYSPLLIQIRSSRTWIFPRSLCHTISDRLSADVMPRRTFCWWMLLRYVGRGSLGGPLQGFPRVNAGGGFHDNLPSSSLVGYDCYVCFWGCSDVHATTGGHSCSGHEYGHCYQSRSRVRPGPSRVRPVPRLGPASTSVGERVPAVVFSFTPRSVPPIPVPMGDGVPAAPRLFLRTVPLSVFFVDVVWPVGHSFFSDVSLGGCG